jgi:hypothetical protein
MKRAAAHSSQQHKSHSPHGTSSVGGDGASSHIHIVDEPQVSFKLDTYEYYQNDAISGIVRLRLVRDLVNTSVTLVLKYRESYVLFDESGDTALCSKTHKKKLIEHKMACPEVFEAGEHHIQFAIRMPSLLESGSFYHSGDSLTASITYKLVAKVTEGPNQIQRRVQFEEDQIPEKVYKGMTSLKVCNHFKNVTFQMVLYDEQSVSRFMCFGGGVTTVEAQFMRDTFCVNPQKLSA